MKQKYMLILVCIMLLINTVSAITYFPPAADWVAGFSAGLGSATADDTKIEIVVTDVGAERYYVIDNPIDLSGVAQLGIDWKSVWTLAFPNSKGNMTVGISLNKNDASFTTSVSYGAGALARQTDILDVSGYFGNYYIKFGANLTAKNFPVMPSITATMYSIAGYNYSNGTTYNTTNIEETTAIVHGSVSNESSGNITCGFWLGNDSVDASNFHKNVTAGNYTAGESVAATATGLGAANYYYVRMWTSTNFTFNVSSNETTFLTKPNAPTHFHIITGPNNVTLIWENSSMGDDTNQSTLIRYSTSVPSPPVTVDWGLPGGNISQMVVNGNSTIIYGLSQETRYYFIAYTYINASGSPEFARFSDDYATATNSTVGGVYNMSIKDEDAPNNLIDLTEDGPHLFRIHYENIVEETIFNNGAIIYNEIFGDFTDLSSGNFTIIANQTVRYFEFKWNNSANLSYRCSRVLIPQNLSGNFTNITFYIQRDRPIYGETTSNEFHVYSQAVADPTVPLVFTTDHNIDSVIGVSVYNISSYGYWVTVPDNQYSISGNQVTIVAAALDANSSIGRIEYYTHVVVAGIESIDGALVQYTYGFLDETGNFKPANDAQAFIYTYDTDGNQLMIHHEYFDTQGQVHPWLIYDKKYFIGVACSLLRYERLGIAPTSGETSPTEIRIPAQFNQTYNFFDVINLNFGATSTEFWANYFDTTQSTANVTFFVYGYYNKTLLYEEMVNSSSKNFTYSVVDGFSPTSSYIFDIIANITAEGYEGKYELEGGGIPWWAGFTNITDNGTLDYWLTIMFGQSPLYVPSGSNENVDATVPWTYVLIFSLCFIFMATLGRLNAFVGTLSVGSVLAFSGAAIYGANELFANYEWWEGPVLVTVGAFVIVLGLVGLMGGVERR